MMDLDELKRLLAKGGDSPDRWTLETAWEAFPHLIAEIEMWRADSKIASEGFKDYIEQVEEQSQRIERLEAALREIEGLYESGNTVLFERAEMRAIARAVLEKK